MTAKSYLGGKVVVHGGDCLAVIRTLAPDSVHAIVTDPPAGIAFMGKDWDSDKGGRDQWVAWMQGVAEEAMRVLKPGGHALVWALPRTSHWTATAWENAGFEVRDRVAHVFGSGFPKSADVSKHIDRMAGAERKVVGRKTFADGSFARRTQNLGTGVFASPVSRESNLNITAPATAAAREWQGWGTALKPALEDWWLLRKPMSERTVAGNVLRHGTGAINIDGCRVGTSAADAIAMQRCNTPGSGRMKTGGGLQGTGTFSRSSATGDLDTTKGRWPANLIHDGSDEVVAAFPVTTSGQLSPQHDAKPSSNGSMSGGNYAGRIKSNFGGDTGSAARFFYSSKADADDRLGSKHPTIKPVDLIQYLVRLITPPNGICLDPFAGTGTTGEAAFREGMRAILIERESEYLADIERRMRLVLSGPVERSQSSIKARGKIEHAGPLFALREAAE